MIRQAVTVAASVGAISISSLRTSPLYDKARPGNQYPRRPAALKGGPAAPTFPVMDFPDPLLRGTLVKRYKRFLSDVELADGTLVTAHCANPGAMLGLTEPGSEVWLSPAANPARKLKYSWEMIRVGDHLVGINTSHPNAIVAEAVAAGRVPELAGYGGLRREVKYGRNSRIDLLLEDGDGSDSGGRPLCYVEVKNVHLRRGTAAEFPDSVTARGLKHLGELGDMVEAGHRAVMFYLVQRGDCDRFRIAADIDPAYAAGLKEARARGVEVLCYGCEMSAEAIDLSAPLPIDLEG
jgi:sugar fermentation stimulation protein A